MRNTVTQAISDRQVVESDSLHFTNREAIPFFQQVRSALNGEYFAAWALPTPGNGAFATIFDSGPLPTNSSHLVEARIVARSTAGVTARAAFIIRALVYRGTGDAAQEGVNQVDLARESNASFDAIIVTVGQAVLVQVRDAGDTVPVDWNAQIRILSSR